MMVRVRKTGWVIDYDYRSPLEGEAQGCVCACVCVPPSSLSRDDGGTHTTLITVTLITVNARTEEPFKSLQYGGEN